MEKEQEFKNYLEKSNLNEFDKQMLLSLLADRKYPEIEARLVEMIKEEYSLNLDYLISLLPENQKIITSIFRS